MGFDVHNVFGINKDQATNGVKKMLGPDKEDYIILKQIPNPAYRAMLTKEHRANAKILEFSEDETANTLSEKILAKVMANTCVVGWGKGLKLKGKELKFSVDNCIALFVEYPKFRTECQTFAETTSNYQDGIREDAEEAKK